jgi:hypothetical protein
VPCYSLQIDSGSPSVSAEGKKCKILSDRLEFHPTSGFPMTVSDSSVGGEAAQFHTTRWTAAMASAHDQNQTGRAALAALCQTYWYPLYAFARRRGYSPYDAQDLT